VPVPPFRQMATLTFWKASMVEDKLSAAAIDKKSEFHRGEAEAESIQLGRYAANGHRTAVYAGR